MFKKNTIAIAIVMATTTTSPLALAADSIADSDVERIEVTGSRINRTDMETASPVTVISADDIKRGGFQSVQEILNVQPTAAGMSLGATSNNGSGGKATVNLRGMGVQRTLVLLNGRRMVASGTGADSSVDLNTIPVSMIKNIEILKDGASAVYGSDAIAGVVNIITKTDYEGTELTLDAGITGEGDGETAGVSILHGREVAGGNLVVGLQFSTRGDVIQSDRDFVPAGQSSYIPGGTLGNRAPDADGNFGDKYDFNGYDYTKDSYAQTPNDLYSLFTSFNKEVADDTELSVDAMYTRRESDQQMAPQPANVWIEGDALDSSITDQFEEKEYTNGKLQYKRRMTGAGPRVYSQETDTLRVSAALSGYLENDDSWDISATYGRNESKDEVANSVHGTNMTNSISDMANKDIWFSPEEVDQAFLQANDILYTEKNKGGNEQLTLTAGYSGIAENDIGYAFGVESRYESGYYTPDLVTQQGDSTAAQQDKTDGDYTVNSVYSEISVPVTEQLAVEAALRYDDYSTFGGATTWKLGATYSFTDTFMLRSVAATGFRAPSVSELYGGNTGSYDYLTSPWLDISEQDQQKLVNYTSDEDLQPEESESFTFGAVWEVTEGLSTTVDYWKFNIDDAISRVDVQANMDNCHAGDIEACNVINITPEGDLSNMTAALTNIGEQKTSGIDWNISYSFDIFKVMLDTTYLLEFEQDGIDYTGKIDGNIGGYSELKSMLTVNAALSDDLNLQYSAQFIQGMEGNAWGTPFKTDDVVYHNVSASYFLSDNWSVNGGVKNLLDQEPEEVPNGNDMNTVPSVYDVIGRSFFVSTSYQF
ncbi:TonB-dependent receptor plug domain-containing protein [Thalassotalea crassostreae]|uniref:TonB-dependent receptor plug domain-containing protein n=1 Tax=Thalassotalea crassostreae TaxID=1763536 RepID=UPI000838277A|nr:TonB-dependent receptor [Thalassotalea crassostreae]